MRPTEELKREHEAIKLMLRILEKVSEKLESGEDVNTDHLDKILEFIQVFADKCHHGKEEDFLFKEMALLHKSKTCIHLLLTNNPIKLNTTKVHTFRASDSG